MTRVRHWLRKITCSWFEVCDPNDFHPVCCRCDWIISGGERFLVIWFPWRMQKCYLCADPHHGRGPCCIVFEHKKWTPPEQLGP